MKGIALTGKYSEFANIIGEAAAEELYQADIATEEKKNEIRQLQEQLLKLPAEDVGTAYKHILAEQVGIFSAERPTEPAWKAENIILKIQILEMEI